LQGPISSPHLGRGVMNLKVVVAAWLSSLMMIPTVQARGPYGSINVGNWKGGAFTSDQTGAFTHCVAGASYDSGIYFMRGRQGAAGGFQEGRAGGGRSLADFC